MTRMAIVRAYFPGKAEDEQFKMVERLLLSKSGSTLYRPSCLRDVLTHLKGSPDMPKMDDLEQKVKDLEIQEAILARTGGTREAKAHRTPEAIKALRPPRDSCFLVMQIPSSTFEAYYPKEKPGEASKKRRKDAARVKTHVSRARTWGTKWTQSSALRQCVNFLWKCHESAGQVWISVVSFV